MRRFILLSFILVGCGEGPGDNPCEKYMGSWKMGSGTLSMSNSCSGSDSICGAFTFTPGDTIEITFENNYSLCPLPQNVSCGASVAASTLSLSCPQGNLVYTKIQRG